MVRVTSDGEWQPWYARRTCPIFCLPCLPAYVGIWSARKAVFVIGVVLALIGVMILLALLLTCIAVECSNIAGGLLPLALILLIVGLLLMHCGWAAHLLDDQGQLPIKKTVTTTTTTRVYTPREDDGEVALFNTAHLERGQPLKEGFWQFEDQEAWQTTSNPYPIQHTLKNCLERQPY